MMKLPKETADCDDSSNLKLAQKACAGDQEAVIKLLEPLHRPLYNLARRMVWHPEDAEDLVQESLLRVLTKLSAYRGEARFATWAYRVAMNTMLNTRRRRMEIATVSFEQFGDNLDQALATTHDHDTSNLDHELLVEEVKVGCMSGMLLCLDRPARLAYILGEIFEIESTLAASLCDTTPDAFRQRLSRARKSLHAFVQKKCGQLSVSATCSCPRMVGPAVVSRLVDPDKLLFATEKSKNHLCRERIDDAIERLDTTMRTVQLFRAQPDYLPGGDLQVWLRQILSSDGLAEILAQ